MKEIPFTIASFEHFLKEKKLMASRCQKCNALWLPPRPICIECDGNELEWVETSGHGKLVAFTVIGVGHIPMIAAGYNKDNPYCVGIVKMDEGPMISAQILDVDLNHPENIRIGTPLAVDFVERGSWNFLEELAKVKKVYLAFRAQRASS